MQTLEDGIGNGPKILGGDRRKPLMERVIETLASGLGNGVGWLAETGILFAVFAVIWIAIAIGIVWNAGTVDEAWRTIRALPVAAQAVVWVLFLPVMLGLWAWESSWPLLVRFGLLIGIAGWNLLIFLPRTVRATT
jgi:hypothetical protein